MIPNVIHYCWFGRNPLPQLAIKCIESWKKYLPEYEIKEWNEDNFDINIIPYTREAYEAKKYAFVSDYARFWILYHHGGLYFDTDVEIIRPMDEIIARGPFMGCERDVSDTSIASAAPGLGLGVNPGLGLGVNPGLGLGVNPGLGLYKDMLDLYAGIHFIHSDGKLNLKTIVDYTTEVLVKYGLKNQKGIQQVAGIWIYPKDFFAPKDVDSKELLITNNTVSIHHYDASWAEWYDKRAGERGPKLKKVFGDVLGTKINLVIYLLQKYGVTGCLRKIFS